MLSYAGVGSVVCITVKPHEWEWSLNVLDVEFLCTEKADQRLERMMDRHSNSSGCFTHQK